MATAIPALDLNSLLKDVPPGAWVALSADGSRVIAYAAEMRDVINMAHEAGERDPIITRVPQVNFALIL